MKAHYVFIISIIFICCTGIAKEEDRKANTDAFFPEFRTVLYDTESKSNESDGLILRFKDQGPRYNFKIGREKRNINKYEEEVFIPFGEESEFRSKSVSLFFKPMEGKKGFMVEKRYDLRSVGGGLKSEYYILEVTNDKLKASKEIESGMSEKELESEN